jgi:DNA-binding MarR family transcriptional regulator
MDKHNCSHPHGNRHSFEEFNLRMHQYVKEISQTDDVIGFEISSSIRMLANMFDSMLNLKDNDKGISGPRMGILMRLMMDEKLDFNEPLTPTGLSRFQNVSKNTISSLIRGLEEQGLVTREIDQNDKRIFRLRITEQGRALVSSEAPQKAVFLNSLIEDLTTDEKEQLRTLLAKLKMSMITKAHQGRMDWHKIHDREQ